MSGYALMVDARVTGEYQHVTARMVALADDGSPRNLSTSDAYRTDPYAGIAASAQADRDPDRAQQTLSYGWRIGIRDDGDPIVLEQLAALAPTLRRLTRSLATAETRYGPPATFGALLARIATALDVPILTGSAGSDGMYSSGQWVTWTPGDAVRIIDRWTAAFRAERAA